MFQALPLSAKVLIVLAAVALYIVLALYAAKFCAFNNTPPRRDSKVPVRRRPDKREAMLSPFFDSQD